MKSLYVQLTCLDVWEDVWETNLKSSNTATEVALLPQLEFDYMVASMEALTHGDQPECFLNMICSLQTLLSHEISLCGYSSGRSLMWIQLLPGCQQYM